MELYTGHRPVCLLLTTLRRLKTFFVVCLRRTRKEVAAVSFLASFFGEVIPADPDRKVSFKELRCA